MPVPAADSVRQQSKHAVKRVLNRHPRLLKNNRFYYELARARAYRDIAVRPELTDRPDLLSALDDRGVVVIPGFIAREEANTILRAAEELLEAARRRELPGKVFTIQPDILCRVAPADDVVPETRAFFQDATLAGLARAYMSPAAQSYRREVDYRFGVSKVAQADLYHFDNWRPMCKAFLYLVDVTEDNAPFVYVPGSHKLESWRRPHNLAYDVEGASGRFGHFFPQEMRELRARFGWEDLVCTGEAGTLVFADLRGLHRGTPLHAGRRVMLTNAFDVMSAGGNGH